MKFARFVFCLFFVICLAVAVYPAVYTVSKIADTNDGTCDADCSFREAVTAANATPDNDTVYFALPLFASPQTITLSGTEIVIANNGSLTVYGTGANRLTISGNNASRIISISDNAVVNISHIRFTGGTGGGAANTGRGGAIYNNGGTTVISHCVFTGNTGANGGAMNNATAGTLTITDSVLANNNATSVGGALQNFSTSTLHIINTAITGNTCGTSSTGGGAMQGNGAITMTNVTMSGNSSQASGGGLYYNGTGLTMTNTTIAGNTAATNAGGLHKSTSTNNANIRNSIIAGNTGGASPDITNVINSLGNNVIGTVGTSTGWIGSDLQNQNPLLSPIGSYGGSGLSQALLTGSPAINAGQDCVKDLTCATNNPPVAVSADQRGAARSNTVDIGAFEVSTIYSAVLPSALYNQAYSHTLAPNVGAFTYTATGGTLPPGVTVNTGAIIASVSGTPGGPMPGPFNFAVTVTDGANPAVINYELNVLANLSIVPVSGRVVNASGGGLGKLTVTLTDRNGGSRSVLTNGFGYFSFDDVAAAETYTVSVSSKQYTVTPVIVTIADAYRSLNLTALP
jgi:CSLREA domain-containing protein